MPELPAPPKLSQFLEPLVMVEDNISSIIGQTGLPVPPGPATLSKQFLESIETTFEQGAAGGGEGTVGLPPLFGQGEEGTIKRKLEP